MASFALSVAVDGVVSSAVEEEGSGDMVGWAVFLVLEVVGESGDEREGEDCFGVYWLSHSIFCASRKKLCLLKLPFVSFPNVSIMTSPVVMIAECPVRPALGPNVAFPEVDGLLHVKGIEVVSRTVN